MGAPGEMDTLWHENYQRSKKVVSDSPGLVDFAIRPVNSVFNLPKRKVKFFGKLKYREHCIQCSLSRLLG